MTKKISLILLIIVFYLKSFSQNDSDTIRLQESQPENKEFTVVKIEKKRGFVLYEVREKGDESMTFIIVTLKRSEKIFLRKKNKIKIGRTYHMLLCPNYKYDLWLNPGYNYNVTINEKKITIHGRELGWNSNIYTSPNISGMYYYEIDSIPDCPLKIDLTYPTD